jgi:hypothetical protein
LWEGSITGYDEALQLVLIVDYIVDWARDIFRPSIMRQLMSVVDKGSRSTYKIIDEPDILSLPGHANSWYGDRPIAIINEVETFEVPAKPAFDAMDSTIGSSLEPLFKSTGKHVDMRVWEGAKYESRVRGLYITEDDADAAKHIDGESGRHFYTVHMSRCWFLLSQVHDIKTIEQAWTGSQETKDVQDLLPQRLLISLYVQYRKDADGKPIRELTYLALAESAARYMYLVANVLMRNALVASGEEVGLKLREAWASSNNNYFARYTGGQASVLCATASDFDRLSDRVVLSFYNDCDTTPYARRLDSFIKRTCENSRAGLYKVYIKCFRYTKAVHSLTVKPHCSVDPTQACVFLNSKTLSSGICVYITNAASEEFNHAQLIRHLAQMVVVLSNSEELGTKVCNILLWIVSDPQWDVYIAIKSTLTMPCIKKVHKRLAWFRKVLLRHKCCSGTYGYARDKHGYKNVQHKIQQICKKCDLTWETGPDRPVFDYCDEDFMPR